MRMFAQKHTARELAEQAQVCIMPCTHLLASALHGILKTTILRLADSNNACTTEQAGMHTTNVAPESPMQVPVLAGSPLLSSAEEALDYARKVGLPVLLKATGEAMASTAQQEMHMLVTGHSRLTSPPSIMPLASSLP